MPEVRSGNHSAAIQLGKDIAASQMGESREMKDLFAALSTGLRAPR